MNLVSPHAQWRKCLQMDKNEVFQDNGDLFIGAKQIQQISISDSDDTVQDIYLRGKLTIVSAPPILGVNEQPSLTCRDIYFIGGELDIKNTSVKYRYSFQMSPEQFKTGVVKELKEKNQTDTVRFVLPKQQSMSRTSFPSLSFNIPQERSSLNNLAEVANAAHDGEHEIVQFCLAAGIDRDPITHKTALIKAAGDNDIRAIQSLLAAKAAVDGKDNSGHTPLMWAAYGNSVRSAEYLIAAKANVYAIDRFQTTPLDCAVNSGCLEIINFFAQLESGMLLDKRTWNLERISAEAMHMAVNGDTQGMDTLLQQGIDVNAKTDDGDTALILAAKYGRSDLVQLLIQNKADPDAAGRQGTALDWSIRNLDTGICKTLFIAGAMPVQIDYQKLNQLGETDQNAPILTAFIHELVNSHSEIVHERFAHAIQLGCLHIANTFLIAGVNPNQMISKGTPLMYAARFNHPAIVRLLLNAKGDAFEAISLLAKIKDTQTIELILNEWGELNKDDFDDTTILKFRIDPTATNKKGKTALMYATTRGHLKMAQLLLNAKADPNGADINGETALNRAAKTGHVELTKMFINNIAIPITRPNALSSLTPARKAYKRDQYLGKEQAELKKYNTIRVLLANAAFDLTPSSTPPKGRKIKWNLPAKPQIVPESEEKEPPQSFWERFNPFRFVASHAYK